MLRARNCLLGYYSQTRLSITKQIPIKSSLLPMNSSGRAVHFLSTNNYINDIFNSHKKTHIMPKIEPNIVHMKKKIKPNKTDKSPKISRKRQWGTERQSMPLSNLHFQPSVNAVFYSRLAIVLTILFWSLYVISVVIRQLIDGPKSYHFTVEVFGYLVVVTFLTFSALVYLIARQGALQRFRKHVRVPTAYCSRVFLFRRNGGIKERVRRLQPPIRIVRRGCRWPKRR